MQGWSANPVQTFLALAQQLLLVPIFLHLWTGEMLAAWLAIDAAWSLAVVADCSGTLLLIKRAPLRERRSRGALSTQL